MHSYGRGAAEELAEHGFVAGLLPKGITDQEYRDTDFPEKDIIEPLRAKAVMAQPLVFLAVAGQVLDGLATWIGIDGFPGLGEKHVVSQMVIDAGIWVNELLGITHGMLDEGLVVGNRQPGWPDSSTTYLQPQFEDRERHLRMLIGVAMLVVGMAPGLRDVGRLTLGV